MEGLSKAQFYKERAKRYENTDPEATIRYRRATNWIEARSGQVIVDVGCKFGLLRDYLKVRGLDYQYIGIDIDAGTLDRIGAPNVRESQESFVCHDVNSGLPLGAATADYVVCLEVMEHLENATAFLEEARRVLKPHGRVIISVPNPYCWMEVLSNLRSRPDSEGHVATFTSQNIDALARFGGLRVQSGRGTFTRLPLSRRLLGRYLLIETDAFFLTRSNMYLMSVS